MTGNDVDRLASAFRRLTITLYHRLSADQGNLFFSPHAIAAALLLIYAGARGTTRNEIEKALGIDLPTDRTHLAFSALSTALADREMRDGFLNPQTGDSSTPVETTNPGRIGYRFNSLAGLWRQMSYECEPEYLRIAKEVFDAEIGAVDFSGRPEEAVSAINRWAEERTEGLIDNVVSSDAISPLTRLIIATATYFKAVWHTPFKRHFTNAAKFHPLNGDEVDIQMMNTMMDMPYSRHAEFQAVEIPYEDTEIRFAVILPDTGKFDAVEQSLDGDLLDAVLFGQAKAVTHVHLQLPRFRLSAGVDLRPSLEAMGIRELFGEQADLTGISSEPGFQIDQVLHNSFISVDEDGTEAAVVVLDVLLGGDSDDLDEPVLVTVDRPFLFFIVDRLTRTVLFAGRMLHPQ